MALQHHEFQLRLRDAEKLWLYVQSGLSNQESLDASLKEAQSSTRRRELEARDAVDRVARVEAKRDAARHEVVMAQLETDVVNNAREQMEFELTRVQRAFATSEGARLKAESELHFSQQALDATKKACQKAEEEIIRLTDERLSLIMEVGAGKEELTIF